MSQIAITNNEERVRQIRLPAPTPPQGSKAGDLIGPLLILPPGLSLVKKEVWDQAKANPNVAVLLKMAIPPSPAPEANPERVGRMILVEGQVVPDESPLRGLKPVQAMEMVTETLDTTTLRAWLTDEARAEVRKAIEKQIATIEAPAGANNPGRGSRPGAGNNGGAKDKE
jgi:hypothetical protein